MKIKVTLFTLLLFGVLLAGCGKKDDTGNGNPSVSPSVAPTTNAPSVTTTAEASPTQAPSTDVVTTASIVSDEAAFLNAIGAEGTWIICLLNDLTVNQDLVLEGEYTNGKKDDAGKDIIQRKIALYTQDANRVVTERYTLTAPKLTIRSPKASIQKGTFRGDVYVEVADFELVDQVIEGNVYFTKQEYMDSFIMDKTSKITGKKEVKAQ